MAATFQPTVLPNTYSQVYGRINSSSNATVMDASGLYMSHDNATTTDDKMDQEFVLSTALGIQVVAFMVMVSVCSVLGTLGNIPVLLVYCASNEKRTSSTFIKVLAVIDLVVCAVIMPYTIILELHLVTSDIICRIFEFLRHLSITASNLTLVAIAVERYMAVCLIGHRLTVHNVNQGMFVVVGISVVVAVPSMAMFAAVTKNEVKDVNCVFPHNFDDNVSFCHFTTSLLGPVLSRAYQTALMLFFVATFVVIVVLYSIVYSSLWRRAKRRSIVQSFRIEVDASSSGETLKKPRDSSLPESEQERRSPRINEELMLCLGNEASECSSDEEVGRLTASCELNGWAAKRDNAGLPASAASMRIRRVTHCKMQVHRRTARMLFLCSVVFLITWLPFWMDVFNQTHNLCLRYLFFLGNASNPLVYGISNAQFRRSFVKLLVSFRTRRGSNGA